MNGPGTSSLERPSRASGRPPGRISVAIVHYRTYRYLEACLESLKRQTLPPAEVWVADHEPLEEDLARLRDGFPEVRFVECPTNRGFAAGANDLIARAAPGHDVLILNADTRLHETFLEALDGADPGPDAGVLGGQLLRENGSIDSLGIGLRSNGRAFDWRPARGTVPDRPLEVFAVSGAAMLLRRGLIDALLASSGECFDPRFWMYHEDLDLCWRARWLGWTCWSVPTAVAEHRRGWQEGGRSGVPTRVRRHSFKNHYLCLLKNAPTSMLLRHLPPLAFREVLRLGYALLFERDVLPAYAMAGRELPRAWRKRRSTWRARRIAPRSIRRWVA